MISRQVFNIIKEAIDAVIPAGGITVSDWADLHRVLSPEASAEPGRWKTSRVPYMREPMDCITDPFVNTVVIKTGSQIAKSEVLNNAAGYFIHHDPCPILIMQPTVDRMKDYSKKRIAPMLRDTPCLAAVMSDEKSRDSDNTQLSKSFIGGHLLMTGANTASALASNPIRVILADEIDRYPRDVDNEGDPLTLAIVRTTTFSNFKVIITSTPTIKGQSRIEEEYELSDRRKYYVRCPHCDTSQVLKFQEEDGTYRLLWETNEAGEVVDVFYVCVSGCMIEEHHKLAMLQPENGAEWIAERPHIGIVGFAINTLYSPWFSWTQIAERFIKASNAAKAGKPELLKVFVNTILGETWDLNREGSEVKNLAAREEHYEAEVPLGVLVLTAGVDVQPDRLEVEIVGWGIGEESWSINYYILEGNTDQQHVWRELDGVLGQEFECEREDATGTRLMRRLDAACIDSGGHNTQAVYQYAKANSGNLYLAIKGASTGAKEAISKRPSKLKGGVSLYMVGTSLIKDTLFGQLRVQEPGAGYCHFPVGYDEEYYKQLAESEKRVRKLKKFAKDDPHGYSQWMYKKIRSRNEALDCRVYAIAALAHLNPNFPRLLDAENLHCAPSRDTMYHDQNFTEEIGRKKFGRKFGHTNGFVSSWNNRK